MITAVSDAGKSGTDWKMCAASPERKVTLPSGKLLSSAFLVAEAMESEESSIPAILVKWGESMMEKRPLPQYASTRCVGTFVE